MARPKSISNLGVFAGLPDLRKPNDGSYAYAYDWASRMITADGGSTETDMYDAFGRLASRTNSSGSYKYFYDLAGRVALTQTASGTVVQPEIYIAGRHFGSIISGNTVFLHTDWLGTGRLWKHRQIHLRRVRQPHHAILDHPLGLQRVAPTCRPRSSSVSLTSTIPAS